MPDPTPIAVPAFRRELILPSLRASTGLQAIDELVAAVAAAGVIPASGRDAVAAAVKKRELSMSTGFGFGVAVPHAATPLAPGTVLAFGRSAAGIDFAALDGQPVRLVALMLVAAGERERHLPTLARVSRLLHRRDVREALAAAADADAIAAILNAPAG